MKNLEPIKSQLIQMSVKNITRSNGKIVMVTIPLEKLARFIFIEKDVQYARGVDNTTRLVIKMKQGLGNL